jgi:hypothetical protein
MEVIKDRPLSSPLRHFVHGSPERERVLDELGDIQASKPSAPVIPNLVPAALVSGHPTTPHGTPISRRHLANTVFAKRLVTLGLDTDEGVTSDNQHIETWMSATAPRETDDGLGFDRFGWPTAELLCEAEGILTKLPEVYHVKKKGQRRFR